MQFENKTIYIISREGWGSMLMSKQHYAIELAKRNNKIYFINHPDLQRRLKRGEIVISKTAFKNITSISHRFWHPFFLKFKYTWLYNFFTSIHIKRICRKINTAPDIVWQFDIGNSLPLKYFPRCEAKIYMPVDGPDGTREEQKAAEKANVIISVTDRILNNFNTTALPKLCVNHGVSAIFINELTEEKNDKVLKAGYSGSLLRSDIDTSFFLTVIRQNPAIQFNFWGEYDSLNSNIHLAADVSTEVKNFIQQLQQQPNVILHGAVQPVQLAEGLKQMDILLIAYNIKNAQNSHKLLEYMATGKVIVSSYLSSYADRPELVEMVKSPDSNNGLIELFNKVVNNIAAYNFSEKQQYRIAYARQFTYKNQLKKIEDFLSANN